MFNVSKVHFPTTQTVRLFAAFSSTLELTFAKWRKKLTYQKTAYIHTYMQRLLGIGPVIYFSFIHNLPSTTCVRTAQCKSALTALTAVLILQQTLYHIPTKLHQFKISSFPVTVQTHTRMDANSNNTPLCCHVNISMHMQTRKLNTNPDIAVVQFGNTDGSRHLEVMAKIDSWYDVSKSKFVDNSPVLFYRHRHQKVYFCLPLPEITSASIRQRNASWNTTVHTQCDLKPATLSASALQISTSW